MAEWLRRMISEFGFRRPAPRRHAATTEHLAAADAAIADARPVGRHIERVLTPAAAEQARRVIREAGR